MLLVVTEPEAIQQFGRAGLAAIAIHVIDAFVRQGQLSVYGGPTHEYDGYVPEVHGIFDDDGRLMMLINWNTDMGDAWEHADDPWYPEPMTALAYRFAVNYLIYSMTH